MSESSGQKRNRWGDQRQHGDRDDGEDEDRYNNNHRKPKKPRISPSSSSPRQDKSSRDNNQRSSNIQKSDYELEREQRMARLRQEMKEEDAEMAALDEQRVADASGKFGEGGADGSSNSKGSNNPQERIIEVNPDELEELDEEEAMMKLMGIQGFGSTKGEAVEDNQSSAARGTAAKNKARKYRQYMNRKNGFNRPLEKMK